MTASKRRYDKDFTMEAIRLYVVSGKMVRRLKRENAILRREQPIVVRMSHAEAVSITP